jgi:hypothetical protein
VFILSGLAKLIVKTDARFAARALISVIGEKLIV